MLFRSTSIGAEGFPVIDGRECFIADAPDQFAGKCIQCLSDPMLWSYFSEKSKNMLKKNYSSDVIAEKLFKIFTSGMVE